MLRGIFPRNFDFFNPLLKFYFYLTLLKEIAELSRLMKIILDLLFKMTTVSEKFELSFLSIYNREKF